MKHTLTTRARRWVRPAAWAAAALLAGAVAGPGPARADTISLGTIPYKNVKILKVENGEVYYEAPSGPSSKPIKENMVIDSAGEPALTAADAAYAAKNLPAAVDGYMKAMTSSASAWAKDYAAIRLAISAEKTQRFDAQVAAWLHNAEKDPARAGDGPPPPPPSSTYLRTAVGLVDGASRRAKTADERTALYSYLLKLQTLAGDKDAANKTRMALGEAAASSGNEAAKGLTFISIAMNDLENKNYKAALDRINGNAIAFTTPDQQAQALFIRASANEGLAGPSKDAKALQDLALDYMRVVAHFPNSPEVPDALMRTAALLEKAGDREGAVNLYKQVAGQYNDRAAGTEAKKSLDRLAGAR